MVFHKDLLATIIQHTGTENKESVFFALNGLIDLSIDNSIQR